MTHEEEVRAKNIIMDTWYKFETLPPNELTKYLSKLNKELDKIGLHKKETLSVLTQ